MSGPVAQWVATRAASIEALAATAPRAWRAWARAALDEGRPAAAEVVGGAPDARGVVSGLDRARDELDRTARGQFFTPGPIAAALARLAEVGSRPGRVLDPACGAGDLLVAAVRARLEAGWGLAEALDGVEGWDLDPVAAWAARAALVELALAGATGPLPGPLRVRAGVDALADDAPWPAADASLVLANPPFLEAKRMGAAAPGLRERLAAADPRLTGAWDLYLAFAWRIVDHLGEDGTAALVLPNRVCQARYAARWREALGAAEAPARLVALVDAGRVRPPPFPGTGVYPALLRVDAGAPAARPVRGARVERLQELEAPREVELAREAFAALPERPWFVPFETWPILAPLLQGPRLGDVAVVASTCSFHARGQRERYVTPERPDGPAWPYLGGPSRARRAEVHPFGVEWAGWWIRYDADALRAEGNPLPDLDRVFLRPKAILRQHALRPSAFADLDGRYVCKDVYPVAWPTHPSLTVERLVAILNSTVFAALYNTVYQGIVVGGETYHYLPAFLRGIPVPPLEHPAWAGVDSAVRATQAGEDRWLELDRAVCAAWGVEEAARERLVEVHLRRVGADYPASAPADPGSAPAAGA